MARSMRLSSALAVIFLVGSYWPVQAQSDRVVPYRIVDGRGIPAPLTEAAGNAENGRKLYFDRAFTGCSGCHGSPGGPGAQANAEASSAPSLAGVASRRSEAALRLWLVAPEVINPDTKMPAYYRIGQRTDPTDPRYGETRLSASEIEDLLAYLLRQTDKP